MQPVITEKEQVSSFLTFYLIHSMQIGVGILGFERYIAKDAGYDAWISIILAGIGMHVALWLSYKILDKSNGDLIETHAQLFGKWIGGFLSFLFVLYCLVLAITVLRTFTEIVQVWIFPELSTWIYSGVFILLALSFVAGGFRVVTGICFFSVLYGLPLLAVKYFPLKYGHFEHLLPIFDHSPGDIMKAAQTMTLNFIGIELLFLYYPFIKHAKSSQKWAHYGVLFTTAVYLITALVSYVYFSEGQLQRITWATLTLWKIVDLPFIERFEYAGLGIWETVVLSNICLSLWAAYQGINRLFSLNSKMIMFALGVITLLGCGLLVTRAQIDLLNTLVSKAGFYVLYGYIPFLFITQLIVLKVRRNQ
ncbi:GerAB/ArcD/ProY family transporter [Bacillus songklensis]|uniref:GerAB/ArcD/ProY family transporter n=1 Tax=Bacillus songklensis TaxID=1069116 RepID=A0ABV8B4P3_9BACI